MPDREHRRHGTPRGRRPRLRHTEARRINATAIDRDVLDRDALRVVARLQRAGHEAYFVGGCVRDLMIGRVPKDFDVATSAHPPEVRRLFRNGRIIGRRFRLVHIYYGEHIIETSTFRSEPTQREDDELLILEDNEYGTAGEDARRRDFTVNALFLDPTKHEILDFVDGLQDLDDRVLRTVGDPDVRMAEDPVRIMRAVKFATRLDFEIEPATWGAMCDQASQLSRSAPPRVLEEILRLMRSGTALGAIKMMRACGALRVVLPDVAVYLEPDGVGQLDVERSERFWRLLEALDSEVHQGYEPTTAVCIAVLFVLIVEVQANADTRTLPGEPPDLNDVCWEVLEPLSASARLSRRDFGRARRIIAAQHRFTQPASKRFSPLLFARTEDFPEALDLFGLWVEARGRGWDIFEGWQDRYERAQRVTEEDLEVERKRTRRRRRRPRRRRGGGGEG
jgi:poly(A) polymerase